MIGRKKQEDKTIIFTLFLGTKKGAVKPPDLMRMAPLPKLHNIFGDGVKPAVRTANALAAQDREVEVA